MQSGTPEILINGAGISGLALKLYLKKRGIESTVVEKAQGWNVPNYGMILRESGIRMLQKLNLGSDVQQSGHEINSWTQRTPDGQVKEQISIGGPMEQNVIVTTKSLLHQELRKNVSSSSIEMGMAIDSIEQNNNGVRTRFSDGSRATFDAIIGADGTDSEIRKRISSGAKEFCGTTNWAFSADMGKDRPDEVVEIHGDDGTVFLYMPCGDHALFWLAASVPDPTYAKEIPLHTLNQKFSYIDWLLPDVLSTIDRDKIWQADNYRVRSEKWIDDRVALMGDAAHAVHPVSGMGASLALEDAFVLADQLDGHPDRMNAQLQKYADRRRPRVEEIQESSRISTNIIFSESSTLTSIRDTVCPRMTILTDTMNEVNKILSGDLANQL